jgi:hypothetical protein
MNWLRRVATTAVMAGLCLATSPFTASATSPVPPFIMPNATGLSAVNYFRAMAGLPAVKENTTWSAADRNHSTWMLYNGIAHYETPGTPFYSASGDEAGKTGNVAVSSDLNATARSHVELWMTGPFHAIGILRYNLTTVGFGMATSTTSSHWHSAATLDVIHGLAQGTTRPGDPIVWPGNGTTTSLTKFRVESPNPLTYCGSSWVSNGAGLPVLAMMPEPVTKVTSATITGPNGALTTCALWATKKPAAIDAGWPTAQALLSGDNAVTVLPSTALVPGVYTVQIVTQARTVRWSFQVDPTAATGVMPVPTVTAAAATSTFTAITPFRFADTRIRLRVTPLLAGVPKRIKVAGTAGVPTNATAISANFTVAGSSGSGHLTVYACSTTPPTSSMINFARNEVIANAGVFPLSGASSSPGAGYLCLYSPVATQVVIDVNGYFTASSTGGRYYPAQPKPWANTLFTADTTKIIDARTVGVPAGASAVAINITSSSSGMNGHITAYPCQVKRPVVSNINPMPGLTRQNFAIVPISSTGKLCLYSRWSTAVKVDLLGYYGPGGSGTFRPTQPTRVVDTRDRYRSAMNLGTAGSAITPLTTKTLLLAGQRGIPSTAKAVTIIVTVVTPTTGGSITVWGGACGASPPVKTITFVSRHTIANTTQVALGTNRSVCIRSSAGAHLVIDITGWWN